MGRLSDRIKRIEMKRGRKTTLLNMAIAAALTGETDKEAMQSYLSRPHSLPAKLDGYIVVRRDGTEAFTTAYYDLGLKPMEIAKECSQCILPDHLNQLCRRVFGRVMMEKES